MSQSKKKSKPVKAKRKARAWKPEPVKAWAVLRRGGIIVPCRVYPDERGARRSTNNLSCAAGVIYTVIPVRIVPL